MKIEKLQDSLELTNDGGLSFFFVGVGSAFSKKHYQNNILIVKGNDHILVDCGITCPSALYNYGSNITKIKKIKIIKCILPLLYRFVNTIDKFCNFLQETRFFTANVIINNKDEYVL